MIILRRVLTLAAAVVLLPSAAPAAGDTEPTLTPPGQAATMSPGPVDYGEIVYQNNGESSRQIFIIGQSHRSALSGLTSPDTVRVQAEIYRIGEWLVQEEGVSLLLPEGFFKGVPAGETSPTEPVRKIIHLDNRMLENELSDTRRFVNAGLLLNATHHIRLEQVEDEPLYRLIRDFLSKARSEKSLSLLSELNSLQNERTATMLQNIPEAVEDAFQGGRIDNRKAMFTIGLNHLNEIITLLEGGCLDPPPVHSGLGGEGESRACLSLLDQGYGVTVIIPRTLAANEQVLRLARLDTD